MTFQSKYIAKKPNSAGIIDYTTHENEVWATLYSRQQEIVRSRACDEFIEGLSLLTMPQDHIPQCAEMNQAFTRSTGWKVQPVEAIIPAEEFFSLLADRIFPAASFIRRVEELDYLQEPDIFHEFFGHCPMLAHPIYADFMQEYGKIALKASEQDRNYLARFYWFTVEFGLIKTPKGIKSYGGGILSSPAETVYAVESDVPKRFALADGLAALRTPYRIDTIQPIYYVIDDYESIYRIMQNIIGLIHQAQDLGDFPADFIPAEMSDREVKC